MNALPSLLGRLLAVAAGLSVAGCSPSSPPDTKPTADTAVAVATSAPVVVPVVSAGSMPMVIPPVTASAAPSTSASAAPPASSSARPAVVPVAPPTIKRPPPVLHPPVTTRGRALHVGERLTESAAVSGGDWG